MRDPQADVAEDMQRLVGKPVVLANVLQLDELFFVIVFEHPDATACVHVDEPLSIALSGISRSRSLREIKGQSSL
ncbi:hypothetical protein PSEUDO8O_170549 [Pseudomonas sp. 8O]|nr:hypothetical protein PSEUDO8O_170549 [Pseudomonas sp. 8O]